MERDLELRHLRYFVAVAEELHFGRAALRLHLAQPPLSQQIRKLESILGHPLFVRTSRAVRLTSAGEVFLERARRTLRNVEEDIEETRIVSRGQVGFLRVGFIGSSMLTPLPAMLGLYRREFPMVQMQLSESYTSDMTQRLLKGVIDAAILRDSDPQEGMRTEKLLSEPFVAVLPLQHRLASRKSLSAADLREEPFVFFPPNAGRIAYQKPISLCEAHGFRPRIVQEAPQWLTVLRLVGAELGVTIAPACVAAIAGPEVICLPLRGANVTSDIELALRSTEDRAIVHSFAAIARDFFKRKDSARNVTKRRNFLAP
ncbi:LysR substrate-binding domain-containing protein [Bryobacter aggregatus]|uniref:LysR substrate-binding domain-containing protein n=1 Tax=Bryobacter aggregatus TaxID=360054 RepID=UPI0005675AFB|nr:LysR substrate-binding domain-containing protein [Bryobacter aggregatus]